MTHRYNALRHGLRRSQFRRREKLRRRLLVTVSLLVLAALAGAFYLGFLADNFTTRSGKIASPFPAESLRPSSREDATNILLLGGDRREGSGEKFGGDTRSQRADTTLLVHLPASGDKLFLVSVARDLLVPIPEHEPAKVTSAIGTGGLPLLVRTVETILEQRVDHVALIDFQGFRGLVDSLGGISTDVPTSYTSTILKDHHFSQGPQEMDGDTALAFVRERRAFPDGGNQRVSNQQAFLKGVMREVARPEILTNPVRVSELVTNFSPFLEVDQGLTSGTVATLALTMKNLDPENVISLTLPATVENAAQGGEPVTVLDEAAARELGKAMVADQLAEFVEERGLDQPS